ncbi:putative pectate lyase 11 [Cryptomeria japonica]|uniref:putative pectate lyase 11 n=1 Tax=Cryptomeria japonica TaxID=3369 RepID=UPI0027DA9EE2|nr:putative pectate lyase 11 [Cryptomeria japonica]
MGNPIEGCWHCDPYWVNNRNILADCGIGFDKNAIRVTRQDKISLSSYADGLIDTIMGSTAITISNNFFTHHDKVMLLGHCDVYTQDIKMQVTVAFNLFGEGLVQRMPRCRHGYFHVVNNDYTHGEMYSIGGSANPTIHSQGNRFLAPDNRFQKEVTKPKDLIESNWRSMGDLMLNGAFFIALGAGASSNYAKASRMAKRPSSIVGSITTNSGVLTCTQSLITKGEYISNLILKFEA